jgi:hypothetical protein
MSYLLLFSTAVLKLPFSVQSAPQAIIRITETFRVAILLLSVSGNIVFPQSSVLTVNRNLAICVVIVLSLAFFFVAFIPNCVKDSIYRASH